MPIRPFEDKRPQIAASAYIDPSAVVIGNVSIGAHTSLWPLVVARGDVNSISIGEYTNIQDGSVLHVTHDGPFSPGGHALRIGSHVTAGHRAILHACTVEDYCLIGMAATVMDGAVLHSRLILAAGSLVPSGKELEGGFLYVGSPAKQVRALTDKELEFLEYSAGHYAQLAERHRGA